MRGSNAVRKSEVVPLSDSAAIPASFPEDSSTTGRSSTNTRSWVPTNGVPRFGKRFLERAFTPAETETPSRDHPRSQFRPLRDAKSPSTPGLEPRCYAPDQSGDPITSM